MSRKDVPENVRVHHKSGILGLIGFECTTISSNVSHSTSQAYKLFSALEDNRTGTGDYYAYPEDALKTTGMTLTIKSPPVDKEYWEITWVSGATSKTGWIDKQDLNLG